MSANEPRENSIGQTEAEGAPNPASVEPPPTEPVPNPQVGPEAERILEQNAEAADLRGDTAAAEEYRNQLDQAQADAAEVGQNGNEAPAPAAEQASPEPLTTPPAPAQTEPMTQTPPTINLT